MNNILRQRIAAKVRQLRKERRWTQAKLSRLLGLSQNRLSEIENGQGSFSAEQLITIIKNFNVPLDYFESVETTEEDRLQNALARLGASHLQENSDVLATGRIKEVINAVSDTIAIAKSPRLLTALAPVIVNYSDPAVLNQIRYKLLDSGYIYRYGWILENVLRAIKRELYDSPDSLSKELRTKYRKAERAIDEIVDFPHFIPGPWKTNKKEVWAIDKEVISRETFSDVRKHSSKVSKKWGIVTRIQEKDFVKALRDGFNY